MPDDDTESTGHIEVLAFYQQNPGTMETVEGLARRLAINVDDMRLHLENLVGAGHLREAQAGGQAVFIFERGRKPD